MSTRTHIGNPISSLLPSDVEGLDALVELALFPRWPQDDVPVGHVTHGVHMPSWDSVEADDLWTEASNKERWRGTTDTLTRVSRPGTCDSPGHRLYGARDPSLPWCGDSS
jgi:hypothetical protein